MVRGDPVCRKEDCSQYDVGLVFKEISSYSDQDKLRFIENVWKPGELFDFPASVECSNSKRHFLWRWLKRFPWLAYSKYLDGAFCLPCVVFGVQCGRNTNKLDKLYKSPLTLWTSAISRFTKHASGKCEMHNLAVIAMENFLRNMRREAVPIDQQINNLLQQQINRNREILKSLFKTIIFCGKNNIVLRGRNLKTYLRNTMVQDRLNGLALMHAHREMELDLEQIIDLFANLHPRRMRMENILNE